jgi:hypothetical protein
MFLAAKGSAVTDESGDRIARGGGVEFSGRPAFAWKAIDTPIVISWNDQSESGASARVSFQTEVRLDWGGVLRHLPVEGKKSWNRLTLLRIFSNSLAGTFRGAIERRGFRKIARLRGHIETEVFDRIVDALVRQKLLRVVERPKYVKQRVEYWQVTEAGLKQIQNARESDSRRTK